MTFANFKITTKVLTLIGLMAILTLATNVYSAYQMKIIDDADTAVIEGPDRANVALAHANRNLMAYYAEIYHLTASTTEEGNNLSLAAAQRAQTAIHGDFEAAKRARPSLAGDIEIFVQRMDRAYAGSCAGAIKAGSSTDPAENAKATAIMEGQCGPELLAIVGDMAKLLDRSDAEGQQMSDDATAFVHSTIATTLASVLIGLVLMSGLAAYLTRKTIARPIHGMTGVMGDMAAGNLDVGVPCKGNRDEIGVMAEAVESFRLSMIEGRRFAAEQKAVQEREAARAKALESAVDAFDGVIEGIVGSVSAAAADLHNTSSVLSATATQTSTQATSVSAGAEEASVNVHTVAASAEELTASISEISSRVADATREADRASEQARITNEAMRILSANAEAIGSVVELVTEIAGQTNLLALNATIEAARAGDAGKGFAVVASEVKSLATQTAKATEEISRKIAGIQESTGEAQTNIDLISRIVVEINAMMNSVAAAVEEQGAATQEISRSVLQASLGTAEVSRNTHGITMASTETERMATETLNAASALSTQSTRLRTEVGSFIAQVKAA